MIGIWCCATGLEPERFYEYNTVHNTGDDNLWGTDSDLDPDELARIAKDVFGLTLRVEGKDRMESLSYLGKQIKS